MRRVLLAVGVAALVLGISLVSISLYDAGENNVMFYSQTMHLGSDGEYYSDLLNMTEAHQLAFSPGPGTTTVYIVQSRDLPLINQSNAMNYSYASMTGTPGGTDGMSLSGEYYIVVFSTSVPPISYYVLGGPSFQVIEVFLSIGAMLTPIGAVTTILGTFLTPVVTRDGEQGSHTSVYSRYRWLAFSTLYIVAACYSFNVVWDFILGTEPFFTTSGWFEYLLVIPISGLVFLLPVAWSLMNVMHDAAWMIVPLLLASGLVLMYEDLFLFPALITSFLTWGILISEYGEYKKGKKGGTSYTV
ncbi:MAG: hypothetical protein M1556_01175 [Candidatus Thermoplasmatota archaeon]|nr:hypothetical protein [Candidatus Thermoplasmatota archaeon]MCL6002246.1 hypothetical protein [Candidatus Thermoplasmatota archaeon]